MEAKILFVLDLEKEVITTVSEPGKIESPALTGWHKFIVGVDPEPGNGLVVVIGPNNRPGAGEVQYAHSTLWQLASELPSCHGLTLEGGGVILSSPHRAAAVFAGESTDFGAFNKARLEAVSELLASLLGRPILIQ